MVSRWKELGVKFLIYKQTRTCKMYKLQHHKCQVGQFSPPKMDIYKYFYSTPSIFYRQMWGYDHCSICRRPGRPQYGKFDHTNREGAFYPPAMPLAVQDCPLATPNNRCQASASYLPSSMLLPLPSTLQHHLGSSTPASVRCHHDNQSQPTLGAKKLDWKARSGCFITYYRLKYWSESLFTWQRSCIMTLQYMLT